MVSTAQPTTHSVDGLRDGQGVSLPNPRQGQLVWIAVSVAVALSFALQDELRLLSPFEEGAGLPIAGVFDACMDWFVGVFKPVFRAVAWALEWPLYGLRNLYLWLPWPVVIAFVVALGYRAGGLKLATFCLLALTYILLTGFWEKTALTVALVSVALPLAIITGFFVGIAGHRSPRIRRLIEPMLDFMQTIPTFAYLVPCLVLFGFGPTVGLIASATFAMPPMARTMMLGLGRVPSDVVESALMSGATRGQLLWLVKLPTAMPTVMLGVNQTILATLSMVVIAAVLGSGEDLGWEVLYTMRQAEFGKSLLTGLAIVLVAMMMDRITLGLSRRFESSRMDRVNLSAWGRNRLALTTTIICLILFTASQFAPALRAFPESWTVLPHAPLDAFISWINTNYHHITDNIRNWTLFFLMLPVKIGMDQVVSPYSWGFELTPTVIVGYVLVSVLLAGALAWLWSWQAALPIMFISLIYFVGITEVPWPVVVLPAVVLAWRVGGWRTGVFALFAFGFMLLSGFWSRSMISIYLCGSAVLLCVLLGGTLGIWAARSDRFSALIRPVNDTLQSIPLFVFLIPVVVLFKVGDFAGLLAIVMYAIVPCIRYTELGIRGVNADTVEAARAMGCTSRQLLFAVRLPLALPEIMLGINQTVLFALAMLVITALVGTKGLGQIIYQSLADGGFGVGICAALCMAFIAMTTDRVIQSWCSRKKQEYGLETSGGQ